MNLSALFPTTRRIKREKPTEPEPTLEVLEAWAKEVKLTIGPAVPDEAFRLRVLRLAYRY